MNIDLLVLELLKEGPKHGFEIVRHLRIHDKEWFECRKRLLGTKIRCFENIYFLKEETK